MVACGIHAREAVFSVVRALFGVNNCRLSFPRQGKELCFGDRFGSRHVVCGESYLLSATGGSGGMSSIVKGAAEARNDVYG
jgi:hypothetical protein